MAEATFIAGSGLGKIYSTAGNLLIDFANFQKFAGAPTNRLAEDRYDVDHITEDGTRKRETRRIVWEFQMTLHDVDTTTWTNSFAQFTDGETRYRFYPRGNSTDYITCFIAATYLTYDERLGELDGLVILDFISDEKIVT